MASEFHQLKSFFQRWLKKTWNKDFLYNQKKLRLSLQIDTNRKILEVWLIRIVNKNH